MDSAKVVMQGDDIQVQWSSTSAALPLTLSLSDSNNEVIYTWPTFNARSGTQSFTLPDDSICPTCVFFAFASRP